MTNNQFVRNTRKRLKAGEGFTLRYGLDKPYFYAVFNIRLRNGYIECSTCEGWLIGDQTTITADI